MEPIGKMHAEHQAASARPGELPGFLAERVARSVRSAMTRCAISHAIHGGVDVKNMPTQTESAEIESERQKI